MLVAACFHTPGVARRLFVCCCWERVYRPLPALLSLEEPRCRLVHMAATLLRIGGSLQGLLACVDINAEEWGNDGIQKLESYTYLSTPTKLLSYVVDLKL